MRRQWLPLQRPCAIENQTQYGSAIGRELLIHMIQCLRSACANALIMFEYFLIQFSLSRSEFD